MQAHDVAERTAVVTRYEREHLVPRADLVRHVRNTLRGKNLACWCAPRACHGDVLLRVANSNTPYDTVACRSCAEPPRYDDVEKIYYCAAHGAGDIECVAVQ